MERAAELRGTAAKGRRVPHGAERVLKEKPAREDEDPTGGKPGRVDPPDDPVE